MFRVHANFDVDFAAPLSPPTSTMSIFQGTGGNDTETGTSSDDTFKMAQAGNDTVNAKGGNDTIIFGKYFTPADHIDGGDGNADVLQLNGDYGAGMTFGAHTLKNVEVVEMAAGNNYNFTLNAATGTDAGLMDFAAATLTSANSLTIDGSAVATCELVLEGGAGADVLTGGGAFDTLIGRGGADMLVGGGGPDHFVYYEAADSTGKNYDTIGGFNCFFSDTILLNTPVNNVDQKITAGSLSNATFNTDLAAAVDHTHLAAYDAVLFVPNAGTLKDQNFLIIDVNGKAGYQAQHDIVICLDQPIHIHSLGAADFSVITG